MIKARGNFTVLSRTLTHHKVCVRFATSLVSGDYSSKLPYSPSAYKPFAVNQFPRDIEWLLKSEESETVPEEKEEPQEDDNSKEIKKDEESDVDDKIKKDEGNKEEDLDKSVSEEDSTVTPASSSITPTSAGGASGGGGNGNGYGNDDPKTGVYPPLLAIPMKDRPPLPGRPFAINITDPEVIRSIYTIIDKREPYFVLFHIKDQDKGDTDIIQSRDSVYDVGVHCQIIRHTSPRPGTFNILGYPLQRIKLEDLSAPGEKKDSIDMDKFSTSYLKDLKVSYATVRPMEDEPYDSQSPDIRSLIEAIKTLLSKMGSKNPLEKLQIKEGTELVSDPPKFADFVGSTIHGDPKKIQEILETVDIEERLSKALELLKVEMRANLIKENTIHNLSSKADEFQTKLFIKEFIKELQKRAGIAESEDKKTHKFDERLKHLKLSEEAMEAYNAERAKMENQNEHSSELGVSERYLDWLTSIPWGIYSKDSFNIKEARKILERDHYGLKDVKERILEFISMGKISGKVDGKILCLAGPPGTGKTSIAKSIAESLNRKYVRIAMGGIQDVHEVKGHRRTYVGSIPGRIISALKQAKTSNPLMLIDEIDKLDLSRGGGAASAFLEILDPEQNNAFVDNYIDVKVDLSKVLFVCTANYLGNIPAPLRDRMEIINVNGYTNNEKLEIAKRHLIPDAEKKAGLEGNHVAIPDATIKRLIEKYCRESGLRNVKKLVTRIFSKASLKIAEQLEDSPLEASSEASKEAVTTSASSGPNEPLTVAPKESTQASEPVVAASSSKETINANAARAPAVDIDEPLNNPQDIKPNDIKEVDTEKGSEEKIEKLKIPEEIKLEITPENLKDYVGPEIYTRDRVYDIPPPGVATGLAYSSSGNGDALYIESILTHSIGSGSGHAGIHVTGSLKEVMKESASIAYSFTKSFMVKNFPENRFFEAADVHVHCPDGAIPKDGPSAGISFTSSLVSLALNRSLPPNIAMTGEITVTGRVLPVGGLREKTLGAKRYGCDTIIFPKDIENELEEIPEEVKEGVTFVPVEWYQEVFDRIFPDVSKEECNNVWKEEFAKLDQKKKNKRSSTSSRGQIASAAA
ncbi:ATP-dependent protease La [Yamadazyma tenuis ATCC 10573]|uniref:Lon protease homolog, mitochondrial n=1 Tax=Candida tenuis (strain ATCC 10573 / BCRC 21748 / CBS 615 / JCM 9827 / NBRC 10315 / NRRL Y-1498 / VKM Y-70) TaxID=590646 RepID=G3BFF0_CANTC|nr:ATP-dependent protease La [Yamadazyma tenuis ATCC 10573]EGV60673.1 ATP-dependent protease La [Yamadazyma tenuis ATCC 10573]